MRTQYGQVFLVDNGGFFPEDDPHKDASWFLMQGMVLLGTDAVGVGDRDLRWGLAYLRENAKSSRLPIVCSNLVEKASGKPAFPTSIVVQKGALKVGFFSLISDKADLGPARDSMSVLEPAATARRMVAELRKKGATVVVGLSNLGKVETEDLGTAVDGIDVLLAGRMVPLVQKGRQIKNTMVVYGGEQGQNVGRTAVTLDASGRKVASMEADVIVLGPEIPDKPEILQLVKSFEDNLNEKMRKAEKEQAAQRALASAENSPDHYVGMQVCERCHEAETAQWKTTAHARAWQTLVDAKKDADPECVKCHVVGFGQPGGFQNAQLSPTLSNVQCEVCHGMGTLHDSYPARPTRVTEATCRQCHTSATSPDFSFAVFSPHIAHKPQANLPPLPQNPGMKKFLTPAPATPAAPGPKK